MAQHVAAARRMTNPDLERRMSERWYRRRLIPCKIGTVPAVVRVHGRDRIEPGRYIRIQEAEGGPWVQVLVDRVNPDDGHFFAKR